MKERSSDDITDCKPRRVPERPHLTLYYEHFYNQLPVMTQRGPLVKDYLKRLHEVILEALMEDAKVFAVRVDLRFPQFYWPPEGDTLSNEARQQFIKILRQKLAAYEREVAEQGGRRHPAHLRYAWAREHDKGQNKPHFHLLLLFNGHAFNTMGSYTSNANNLYNRICDSWAEALGLVDMEGRGLAEVPENGQYLVHRGNERELQKLFLRASYLTKYATKNFNEGYHPFGVR